MKGEIRREADYCIRRDVYTTSPEGGAKPLRSPTNTIPAEDTGREVSVSLFFYMVRM